MTMRKNEDPNITVEPGEDVEDVTYQDVADLMAKMAPALDGLVTAYRAAREATDEGAATLELLRMLGNSTDPTVVVSALTFAVTQQADRSDRLAAAVDKARRLNQPMMQQLRSCAADTSSNWEGAVTVYPPSTRDLVALIDYLLEEGDTTPDGA